MAAKSVERHKAKVRAFWDGCNSQPLRERRRDWLRYVRGWWQYYRLCEVRLRLSALSSWTRRHIRKAFWLRWHDWRGRRNALARLGATDTTLRLAHSSRGAWRAALALNSVLTNARLRQWGLFTPADFVDALTVTSTDANRRMRENRTSGGVGGVTGAIPSPRPDRSTKDLSYTHGDI